MDRSFRTTPRSMRVLTLSSSFLRTILLGLFFVALFELGTEQDKLNCFEFGGWMEINKGFMLFFAKMTRIVKGGLEQQSQLLREHCAR